MTFELDAGKIQQGIFAKVWPGIDMRTQEKLMEKAEAIHSLVTNEKVDVCMALFEIMIVRFQNAFLEKDLHWIPEINKTTYGGIKDKLGQEIVECLKYLQERVGSIWLLSNVYCTKQLFYSEAGDKYDKEVALAKEFRKLIDIVQ